MKKFVAYFRDFLRHHWDWRLYLATFALVGLGVWLNFQYDFERTYIGYRSWAAVGGFFLLQSLPFYLVVGLQCYFKQDYRVLGNATFWWLTALGFFLLAFSRGFPYTMDLARLFPQDVYYFAARCLMKGKRLFLLVLPLYLLYRLTHRRFGYDVHFYGLTTREAKVRPYVILLLCMVPLIYLASLDPSFTRAYPKYHGLGAPAALGVPEYVTVMIYEAVYGIGFIAIELFFRGFLVIGLAFLLGKDVILPMAATYVFLHFGKPMGEAISSFFGGYILGVIALYSGNIWGGVFVHVGIAWLMELAAWWQKLETPLRGPFGE